MFGVVCSANNASILIECTGSAKWGENNNEDDDDADDDVGDDNHEDYAEGFFAHLHSRFKLILMLMLSML